MINGRLITVLVFALVVASAASFAVYHFLVSGMKQPAVAGQAKLLVANRDLEVGSLIHEADIREMSWNGQFPANALNSAPDIIGRGVVATIYKDEPFFPARLAGKGAGAGLAATIPLGKRAVALRVNDVVGLAGFVQPGMRVDVLIAGLGPGIANSQAGVVSRTVLQNIEVLSAGQKVERNPEGKPEEVQVVNLLVTPDQAEVLSLAGSETKVQLVMRNPLDTEEIPTQGTSLARLFGQPVEAPNPPRKTSPEFPRPHPVQRQADPVPAVVTPSPARAPATDTIEVFTGGKKSEQHVPASSGVR